jgi:DNA-binding protein HU-beta
MVLPGFGTFTCPTRKARKGRNPKTGEAIEIPAYTIPVFRPSKKLKASVNAK